MRARIGATQNIAGEPKHMHLEIQPDDMPAKVLCKILRKLGYLCSVIENHGVVIEPHRKLIDQDEDAEWV